MRKADITHDNLYLGPLARKVYIPAAVVGVVGLAISAILGLSDAQNNVRMYEAYVVAYSYFLSLALGALFFVALQHLTGAGWSVTVRRLAEGVMATIPILALLAIPVLLGMRSIYPWADPAVIGHDHLLTHKQAYLNPTFFIIRWIVYFFCWSFLAVYFIRRSTRQDVTGQPELTVRLSRRSALAMVVFALTITFAAFDLLMSRDPHWYSTIYGVYYFSGSAVGFFALLTLGAITLQRAGRIQHAISREHYHDLGKLIFAFIVFWAYIAFSQYVLIWYANIPEETSWFLRRQTGSWTGVSLFLLFGHFIVPFLGLISRTPKRRVLLLAGAAMWLLFVHWVDLYWLVMPESAGGSLGFSWLHVTCTAGIGGLFLAAAVFALRRRPLIPLKDPRLDEALAFENV